MRAAWALLLLAGCAARVYYAEPGDSRETYARIDLVNESVNGLYVRLYEDPISCKVPIYFGADEQAPTVGPRGSMTIYAKKGAPVTLAAWYGLAGAGPGLRSCYVSSTFVPTAPVYDIVYSSDGAGSECMLSALEEADGKRGPLAPGRIIGRELRTPLLQNGAWCSELNSDELATISGVQ